MLEHEFDNSLETLEEEDLDLEHANAASLSNASAADQQRQIVQAFFMQYARKSIAEANKLLTPKKNTTSLWSRRVISNEVKRACKQFDSDPIAKDSMPANEIVEHIMEKTIMALMTKDPLKVAKAGTQFTAATTFKYSMRRFAQTSDDNSGPKELLKMTQELRAQVRSLQNHLSNVLLVTKEMHVTDHVDRNLFTFLLSPKRYELDHVALRNLEEKMRKELGVGDHSSHPRIISFMASKQTAINSREKLPQSPVGPLNQNCLIRIMNGPIELQDLSSQPSILDLKKNELAVRLIYVDSPPEPAIKRIRIEFADDTQSDESEDHDTQRILYIFLYREVVADLKTQLDLLQSRRDLIADHVAKKLAIPPHMEDAKPIAPIFIPSKDRFRRVAAMPSQQSHPIANLLVSSIDQRVQDVFGSTHCRRLVFSVHEVEEFEGYVKEFAQLESDTSSLSSSPASIAAHASETASTPSGSASSLDNVSSGSVPHSTSSQLIFVAIPGQHRGVGFARSMIVILQHALRYLCRQSQVNFDLFWQLDDDIRACLVNDPRNPGTYLPCSLAAGLAYAQDALMMEIEDD